MDFNNSGRTIGCLLSWLGSGEEIPMPIINGIWICKQVCKICGEDASDGGVYGKDGSAICIPCWNLLTEEERKHLWEDGDET